MGLLCLQHHGIGNNDFTTISVVPTSIHLHRPTIASSFGETPSPEKKAASFSAEDNKLEQKIGKFYQSIKSRMLVAEVISRIRAGAKFNFDFLMLLILAGLIIQVNFQVFCGITLPMYL